MPEQPEQNQTLGGHRGGEDRIRPAPLRSSGGRRVRAHRVTVDGLRGLLILLSLPERSLSGLGLKKRWGGWDKKVKGGCGGVIILAWEVITYHTYLYLPDSCALMKSVSSL